jgi:hypothetical protein
METSTQPGICPECGRANLESAHFYTHCHHILIYSTRQVLCADERWGSDGGVG